MFEIWLFFIVINVCLFVVEIFCLQMRSMSGNALHAAITIETKKNTTSQYLYGIFICDGFFPFLLLHRLKMIGGMTHFFAH